MCIRSEYIAIIREFSFGHDWQTFKLRLDKLYILVRNANDKNSLRIGLATIQNYILIKFCSVWDRIAIVQSRAEWNVYPLKMSTIKICSGAFDRHRRRYNRQYVHTMSGTRNYDSNVQRSRRYVRKPDIFPRKLAPRTLRLAVSKWKSPKVKPGSRSNRRHANYAGNIRVRFSQNGTLLRFCRARTSAIRSTN